MSAATDRSIARIPDEPGQIVSNAEPENVDVSDRFDLPPRRVWTQHTYHPIPGMEDTPYYPSLLVRRADTSDIHIPRWSSWDDVRRVTYGHRMPSRKTTDTEARLTPQVLKRLDVSALWDGEPPQEWILEPIIRVGGGTQIQSVPGLGKSLLAQDIAMTLGNPDHYVLGVKPDRAYRVLYIDFENDPHRDLLPRLEALGYDRSPEHYEHVYFVTMPDMASMDTPQGGAVVLRTAKAFRADVVIVDTLGRSVDGPENESDTFHRWYRYVGMPLKREGIAWVRLDHVGKDSSKGARGSSAKGGDVDLSWDMRACRAGDFRLVNTKARGQISEQFLTVKRETVDGRLTHRVETHLTEHQARVDVLVAALDDAEVPADASVRATKTAIRDVLQISAKNEVIEDAVRRRKDRAGLADHEGEES